MSGRKLRPLPEWLILDDVDREACAAKNWYIDALGYPRTDARGIDGKYRPVRIHVFLIGRAPSGMHTDHINGNKLDNRRANLRHISHRGNLQNQGPSKANKTGVRGVWCVAGSATRKTKYNAQARNADGRVVTIGVFLTLDEAAAAMRIFRGENHEGYAGRDRREATV